MLLLMLVLLLILVLMLLVAFKTVFCVACVYLSCMYYCINDVDRQLLVFLLFRVIKMVPKVECIIYKCNKQEPVA